MKEPQPPAKNPHIGEHKHTNRLIHSVSPYLLQHAHNPVDWREWGDEAFKAARDQDKPIFLSIGYSTCHWCHVMERECFEVEEIATLLNDAFVCVKLDREERPDIDDVYMHAFQVSHGGGGGWPLSAFLDHDLRPFYMDTYIPPADGYGRPGLRSVTARLDELWKGERARLLERSAAVREALETAASSAGGEALSEQDMAGAAQVFTHFFDKEYGGFNWNPGGARQNKFPTPHNFNFLLRRHKRTGNKALLTIVQTTLTRMARGGIHDHVGGGFHRYSTDREWLLPHFEKMLYDQAGLAIAYLEAFQVTGDPLFADTARDIFSYVLRDLADKAGGFFSAQDADSEGEEGKFYVWTMDELKAALGEADGTYIAERFGCTKDGNFRDEASGAYTGANILHLPGGLDAATEPEKNRGTALLATLCRLREKRVRPSLDDKVLTGWNAHMISALTLGARVLGDDSYRVVAKRCADFLWSNLRDERGNLLRAWRKGKASIPAFAEDYAYLTCAYLDLYRADCDVEYLERAVALAQHMLERFEDKAGGGLFTAREGQSDLIVRRKDIYDGAQASANSVAAETLVTLAAITGREDFSTSAAKIFAAFAGEVGAAPSQYTRMLCALDLSISGVREVVIAVPSGGNAVPMMDEIRKRFLPDTFVILRREENAKQLARILPFTDAQTHVGGKPTAYVCRARACQKPVTEPNELAKLLDE